MPDTRTYAPADRPAVEVEVNGRWLPGELRMWTRREGGWWAQVSYSEAAGMTRIETVPASRVREV